MELGLTIGLSVGLAFMLLTSCFYRRTLALKAEPLNRTAEKIGDKFYYIVPEREYVEMERVHLLDKAIKSHNP